MDVAKSLQFTDAELQNIRRALGMLIKSYERQKTGAVTPEFAKLYDSQIAQIHGVQSKIGG